MSVVAFLALNSISALSSSALCAVIYREGERIGFWGERIMGFFSSLLGFLGFGIGFPLGLFIGFYFFIYSESKDVEVITATAFVSCVFCYSTVAFIKLNENFHRFFDFRFLLFCFI